MNHLLFAIVKCKLFVYFCKMELNERIIEIMENSGLTPSEFADKIEVQRSAISHIASGRNKPSLDFLLKIKEAFPEIDTDWLFLGEKSQPEISDVTVEESPSPTLFDRMEKKENTGSLLQKLLVPEEQILEEKITESDRNTKSDSISSQKPIRVILFFEDGSFEDFCVKK